MIGRLSALMVLAGALLGACGGDDDDGNSSATRYVASCNSACTELHNCSSNVDVTECSNRCKADFEDSGPNFNTTFLAELDECVAGATCLELGAEVLNLGYCETRARANTQATSTVTSFCDAVAAEDRDCSRAMHFLCVEGLKIFSDSAIQRAQRCVEEPCDLQESCVEDVLGVQF
jgi:hypothetical protein